MDITLNHTIIASHNHVEGARFYQRIFGFEFVKQWGHFVVVKVNDTLTLDFMNQDAFSASHYAFKVSEQQFDEILSRLTEDKVVIGSGPQSLEDGQINTNDGGRGVYFKDPDGHVLEILTVDYVID